MLNRGPSDRPDEKPEMRCSVCRELRPCTRGSLRESVAIGDITFDRHWWYCQACLSAKVRLALAQ